MKIRPPGQEALTRDHAKHEKHEKLCITPRGARAEESSG